MAYTSSAAISGLGTTLTIDTAAIGEIRSITQSGAMNKTADVTNLSSTSEEWICVIPSAGKFDVEVNYVPADAGQIAVATAFTGHTTNDYVITLPNTKTYTFKAIVEEYEVIPKMTPTSELTHKYGFKVSGPITAA